MVKVEHDANPKLIAEYKVKTVASLLRYLLQYHASHAATVRCG